MRRSRQQARGQSRPGIHYYDGEHASIRYRLAGSGERTIVFTPDPPMSIEHYDELIALLEHDFRIIVFDLPGFGFSRPKRGLSFGFDEMTLEIENFLLELGFASYVLAFSCVAGFTAAAIASRQPKIVSHLLMIQTPGWPEALDWKARRDRNRLLQTRGLGQLLSALFKRRRSRDWLTYAINNEDLRQKFSQIVDDCYDGGAMFSLASVFQDYLVGEMPGLNPVQQPVLIVWGQHDASHRATDISSSNQLAPHAQKIHFDDAGHFPELEYAPEFSKAVRDFVYQTSI